jgi:predicted extracellular nuclease
MSSGNPLPPAIVLGEGGRMIPDKIIENDVKGIVGQAVAKFDPEQDGMDFYESLEGMRVQINDALAISFRNSYNEIVVLADKGKNASGLNPQNVLLLSEDDPNPERLILDDKYIKLPEMYPGCLASQPVFGILEYDFGNFRIQPTERFDYYCEGFNENFMDTEAISLSEAQISVLSFNMQNFSHVDSPERLGQFAELITHRFASPDILVLQEIMDDDGFLDSGTVSAFDNLQALQKALEAESGLTYQWFNIDPERNRDGGAEGSNIRTVIMFRMDRGLKFLSAIPAEAGQEVGLIGKDKATSLSNNPGLISPDNSAFRNSRKPIIAQFQYQDEIFYVIGVHFYSKGSDGSLFGAIQPPNFSSEEQRVAQAKAVNDFVKEILERDHNARIIVAGDMNDFPWSQALKSLKGGELNNLWDTVERNKWHSYIHEGNAEVLDHMLVSEAFLPHVRSFSVFNINSVANADRRLSDHDPILAVIDFSYYE